MIWRLKNWIVNVVRNHNKVMPSVVEHNSPFITIYKIGNGYLFHKNENRPYSESEGNNNVIYCANILDVCRQMINKEALQKLGIKDDQTMHTSGVATASFVNKSHTQPFNPNSDI